MSLLLPPRSYQSKPLASILCRGSIAIVSSLMLLMIAQPGCDTQKPVTPKVGTTSISNELESLKNRCVALTENGAEADKEGKMIDEAVDGFRKLAKELPKEQLSHQNLAVALIFQIRNSRLKNRDTAKLEEEFLTAVESVKKIDPESPDAWLLASRFYQDKGDMPQAETALREAINKKNAAGDTFFQLYELIQSSGNPQNSNPAENRKLLEAGLAKSPTNLALQVAYLNNLAMLQDEATFAKHFELCKQSFIPMVSRTGPQLKKLLERIQSALENKEWKVVQTQTIFIRNSMLAEIAYVNDLHLLKLHVLELLKLE